MKHFWKGFATTKTSAPVRLRKHVIVLYFSSEDHRGVRAKDEFKTLAKRYPSVAVKTVDILKNPLKPSRHKILNTPTIILLKDGREIDRMDGDGGALLLEHLFRKAQG